MDLLKSFATTVATIVFAPFIALTLYLLLVIFLDEETEFADTHY